VSHKPWSSTTAAPEPPLDRPVWVDLEAFWGPPDDDIAGADDPVPGGLPVATGRVPGLLNGGSGAQTAVGSAA
jgi:hypothetical protein